MKKRKISENNPSDIQSPALENMFSSAWKWIYESLHSIPSSIRIQSKDIDLDDDTHKEKELAIHHSIPIELSSDSSNLILTNAPQCISEQRLQVHTRFIYFNRYIYYLIVFNNCKLYYYLWILIFIHT